MLLLLLFACNAPESCKKTTWYADQDGDGAGDPASVTDACAAPDNAVENADDCDDRRADVLPGGTEVVYDGADNDCDPNTPDDDLDSDGYGLADDCDDADPARSPDAAEVGYDGLDNDCDPGTPDDDLDGDGFMAADDCDDGNNAISPLATEVTYDGLDNDCDPSTPDDDLDGDGFVAADDCDDADPTRSPAVMEVDYDGIDNDCDPNTPDDDIDQDGYLVADDCDDTNPSVSPGSAEAPYNGIDDDCNSATPDDDIDQDGYLVADDCDDTNPSVSPSGIEITLDGLDNDCDPTTPDDDYDGDGYGSTDDCNNDDPTISPDATEIPYDGLDNDCDATTPDDDIDQDGFVAADDCDDLNADVAPDAREACGDLIDNNCDGLIDACIQASRSVTDADATWTGEANDCVGLTIAGPGDVNGDGYDDVLLGAYGDRTGVTSNSGTTWLIWGSDTPSAGSIADAEVLFTGEAINDFSGSFVARAGDVNNDGYADMLISSFLSDRAGIDAGTVYLIYGGSSLSTMSVSDADVILTGESATSYTGSSTAGGVDINADGQADLVIGAGFLDNGDTDTGGVYLVLDAQTSGSLSGADAKIVGASPLDYLGAAVTGLGDVNNDGYDDVLVGSKGYDASGRDTGAALLILGSAAPVSGDTTVADAIYTGKGNNEYAGEFVAGAGDVNNDGYDDMLIGARYSSEEVFYGGAAYLVLGSAGPVSHDLADADATYAGVTENALAGGAVAGVGDIDQDGYDDVMIGAPAHDIDDGSMGSAFLILGSALPTSLTLDEAAIEYKGNTEGAFTGQTISAAGDVNADGYPDVLIGELFDSDGGSYAGATHLFLQPEVRCDQPEAEVAYDGFDNDCDPSTPDDDLDGDLYGLGGDCDDDDAAISPAAAEICGDGIDNDCDGYNCP